MRHDRGIAHTLGRPFVTSALLLVAAALAGVLVAEHCPGCLDRNRINKRCEWTGDDAFPIAAVDPPQRAHLVADAQLAEDLAIRHADAEFNRRYGYEAHGGLIDDGRMVRECWAQLTTAIAHQHGVTVDQIEAARAQRNRLFDLFGALSFAPLWVFGSLAAAHALDRRFSSDARAVRLTAIAVTSAAASVAGLQLAELWMSIWESIRVRNGHISSFRAATWSGWVHAHFLVLFLIGVAAFWIIAAARAPRWRTLARDASAFSVALLAVAFVDVFLPHALGIAGAGAGLLALGAALAVDRRRTHEGPLPA